VDGTDRPPLVDGVVVVAGDRIRAVGPRASVAIPAGARRIELAGRAVIPGLIDLHVHLSAVGAVRGQAFGAEDLQAFLAAGVTAVRSTGDAFPWILEVRGDLAAGRRAGPRLFAVGPILTAPGGHPAGTWMRGAPEAAAVFTRQVTDAGAAREEVRRLAEAGVDAIKAVYDGGDDRSPFGRLPRLSPDALRAAVAEARGSGRRALVHWGNVSELAEVLDASPHELEHVTVGTIPEPLLRRIVADRVAVTPTLAAFASFLPPAVLERQLANVRRLAEAGAVILAGSDAPLGPAFGAGLHQELELLVRAGLTPQRALQAATRDAAAALGAPDLGVIEPGRQADLVVLAADPTQRIGAVREVQAVFLGGRAAWEAPGWAQPRKDGSAR
jgi:enamidase